MANDISVSTTRCKEIVISCVKALNSEDFKTARKYVSDNFSFIEFLASAMERKPILMIWKNEIKIRYQKIFVNENDVCLFI